LLRFQKPEVCLPPLPSIKVMLCARLGLRTERASVLIKQLSELFFHRIFSSVRPAKLDAKR